MAEHNITQEVQLLTKAELAKRLRCSTKTIDRRIECGLIKVAEGTGGDLGRPLFDPMTIPALRKQLITTLALI